MSPMLEVRGLSKRFGGLTVTDAVSFSIAAGERVAMIGPNGAGKTTFVNLAAGALTPDAGDILLEGRSVVSAGPAERARRGLVRSFQITRLFADMTPSEHLALAILQREGRAGRMTGDWRRMPVVVAEVDGWLARFDLTAVGGRRTDEIAYGQKRLLELALALALRPKALLLDEPASGVAPADRRRIEAALADLPPDLAVLMIDHDMDLVFRFARRVIVLAAGAVIFDGTPGEASRDPRVRAAYLGPAAGPDAG